MSIRIQNDQAAGIATPQTGRTDVSGASTSSGNSSQANRSGSGDRVEVSSITESIAAGISNQSAGRTERVHQLSALYAAGHYDADASRVSSAIVANAVVPGTAGRA